MADNANNPTDEFVRLLAKDDSPSGFSDKPSAIDEIIFRDKDGSLKVLKDGNIVNLEEKSQAPKGQAGPASVYTKPVVIPSGVKPLDFEPAAQSILSKASLNIADPEAQKRLKNIILLRLRDVRDQLETREILLAAPATGGMGFDTATTQKILQLANQELDQLDGKLRRQSESADWLDQPPAASAEIPEVKFKPKLVGPLEEIRLLNLDDFHRFSPDPAKAAQRILEKINALESQSFAKKMEAIKAWRQSEIFNIYLKIGRQSMELNQPVTAVVTSFKSAQAPTLTKEEFEVISQLNALLKS